jgi:hypothetical protein
VCTEGGAALCCVCLRAAADGATLVVGSVQGDVWKLPDAGTTPAVGKKVAVGLDGAILVARNHGTLAPKVAEGVGRGAGSGLSGIGGSGVSEDTVKGVAVQVAPVVGVSYPKSVSDRFATASHDNTVWLPGCPPVCGCKKKYRCGEGRRGEERGGAGRGGEGWGRSQLLCLATPHLRAPRCGCVRVCRSVSGTRRTTHPRCPCQ